MERVISITNARRDLFNLVSEVNEQSQPIILTNTKGKNAVLVGEDDWKAIIETLYLSSVPGLKEKLIKGKETPLEDCVSADEVEW